MTLAIMQPYFFPYLGYWQLLSIVDSFVIYDDVTYIKQGFINRNKIISANQGSQHITLEILSASSNKLINNIEVGNNLKKLLKSITQTYKKAPQYETVFPLFQEIMENNEKNLAKFLGNSIQKVVTYLEIDTNILYSSDIEKNSDLKGQNKILDICQRLEVSHYINTIGGQALYSKKDFSDNNIKLSFIKTELIEYQQFQDAFVPYLSIIDIMMFNSKKEIQNMLTSYTLV